MIAFLLVTPVFCALDSRALEILFIGVQDVGSVGSPVEDATAIVGIVELAVLAFPFGWAVAGVISQQILAHGIGLLARIAKTLVLGVNLTVGSSGAGWTVASVADATVGDAARASVQTWFRITVRSRELTVVSIVVARADAGVSGLFSGTDSTILAGRAVAEVYLNLAVPAHVARLAVAVVVVHQLHAVLGTGSSARVGQTFVNVTFATRANESWRALALEASDFVDAGAVVMTGIDNTIVDIDFTEVSESSRWTRAAEVANEIMTGSAVLTRVETAIVNVQLAVLSLESLGAVTLIRSHEVSTSSSVLARCGVALVDLGLTVASGVALVT